VKASQRGPSSWPVTRSRARSTHAWPPTRDQISPTTTEVPSEPRNRASTILGCPGKATAVATSTTGLTAGAASMNASAAAGWTPRAHKRPAIGTDAHSQPGSAVPASAAPGTASRVEDGRARSSTAGDTSAVIAPLTSTPRARKGRAWTTMATNTVVQVRSPTGSSDPRNSPRVERAITTSSTTSRPSSRRCRGSDGASVDVMADKSRLVVPEWS
jgi:hypothetical protein